MTNPYDADLQLKMARNHIELFRSVAGDRFLTHFEQVKSRTMLSIERLYDLYLACQYVDGAGIPGCVVEVGTWQGGALGMAILSSASSERKIIGFDTYAGHLRPAANELDIRGHSMRDRFDDAAKRGESWAEADLEECREFLMTLRIPPPPIDLVKGDVKETLKFWESEPISILRIDCDWYLESLVSLEVLWPHVSMGGIVIMDDYGHHLGQRRAVDEFFADRPVKFTHVDYSCLSVVKTRE
jgi:hypothetical protein